MWPKNRMISRRVSSLIDRAHCQGIEAREVWGETQSTFEKGKGLMLDVPRSEPSVVPALLIPLPGTTRLWGNDQGSQRG